MRFRVTIGVLAGDFADQRLAYAHLLDVAPRCDAEQVEVLVRPFGPRLAGFFAPDVAERLEAVAESGLVLLLPGSGVPFAATGRLRAIGRLPGTIVRAVLPEAE